MLTECPSCLTVFRVTPAILKMGHGQVRCGKCRQQFDAIECMLDEEQVEVASAPPPIKEPAPKPPPSTSNEIAENFVEPTYAEEVIMEGSRIEISGTYRIPGAADTKGADSEEIVRERVVIDRRDIAPHMDEDSADDEDADDEQELIDAHEDDDDGMLAAADDANEAGDDAEELDDAESHGVTEAPPVPNRWRRMLEQKQEQREIHAELSALTERTEPRVLRTGVWTTFSIVFAVALIAQLIHHNRDALVRDPHVGATVSRLYRALGMSPTPHWDLAAYKWDIYKVGLDPQVPEALRVVGSVANDAPFAQPFPFGKLSLQDRWGSPVGERAFEPHEYLPSPEIANRLMAPKQRANIEIVIDDPGADAVGYAIHACLEQDHRLACADDLPVFK